MANETGLDSSGMSGALPNWLRTVALEARYASQKLWQYAYNATEGDEMVSGQIKKAGDRVTIQIFPKLTASDISTTDGSFTDTEVVLTQATVIINKWKNISANLVDIVDAQAVLNWEREFARSFGAGIAEQQEDDLLALVNDLTTNIDSSGGAFLDPKVRAAQLMLDNLEVPKEDRVWGICHDAHADLLGADKFTLANQTGFDKGVQVDKGRVVGLYGTPVVATSRVTTTSSKKDNVLFHKQAFGVVMQKDFEMGKFAKTQYATKYHGSALYGVATLRDNHAVWVTSA